MDDGVSDRNWGSLAVALGLVLVGLGSLAGLAYVDITGEVTRAEYDAYASNCAALANETALAETGLGREPVELGPEAVQRCRNTTYVEYRRAQRDSMREAPLNAGQWALYGGFGLAIAGLGVVVLRQELR